MNMKHLPQALCRCLLAAIAALSFLAAPQAQAAGASIFNAWWVASDHDMDGCWAPETADGGLKLYWDADVTGVETLGVYEKIYSRPTGTTEWTLIATNALHFITANSPADAQFVEVPPAGDCASRDYRIELFLAGPETIEDIRDASNDEDLNGHREETFEQDLPPARIYDAWWSRAVDRDGDGCFAPETELGAIRLHWDADVTGPVSVTVLERIYTRPTAGGKWTLLAATAPHVITGNSTADAQFLDITPAGGCATLDYKIELYRQGAQDPDYTRDATNDPDLAGRKQESYIHDTGPVIADAWWSNVADNSLDGCVAPLTPSGLLRLNWDPNIAGGGSLAVIERVYYRTTGTEDWTLLHTTARHTITGTLTTDAQFVDVPPGSNCEARDYLIELYRAENDEPDDIRDGSRDPDLAGHKEQTYEQDNAVASIADAWWADAADNDGDGCFAPNVSSTYFRLFWNPEAPGDTTMSVFEKVWWRESGGAGWTLAATTQPHPITGSSSNDLQFINLSPGANCTSYDYRIDIFRQGYEEPDNTRGPGNDPDLSAHSEETWADDNLLPAINGVWWSHITDNDEDGCFAPEGAGSPVLHWNPDVANGGSLTVYERIYRRASGTEDWNIFYTSEPYEISGLTTNDARSLGVPQETDCVPVDYRIELLRAGKFTPDAAADAENEPLLAGRRQETPLQDAAKAVFASTWWSGMTDHDGDECMAPLSPAAPILLHWDADFPGAASGQVFARVYSRPAGGGDWTLAATNAPQLVSGSDTNDAQFAAIIPPASCATLDFRIELWQPGMASPDGVRDADTDPLLAGRRLESYPQDNLVPTIADAWWSRIRDNDHDQCFAPDNRANLARLNWTPGVSSPGMLSVYELVYSTPAGGTNWSLIATNAPHAAYGDETNETQFVEFIPSGDCIPTDYKIEIYTVGGSEPGLVLGPFGDPDLASQKHERYEQDNTLGQINNAWWSAYQDFDGDGCVAPASPNSGLRLHWDPDVSGPGGLIVFERVYRRAPGGDWVLLLETAPKLLSGTSAADAQSLEIMVTNTCGPVDYRIELRQVGAAEPDSVRDYTNDSALSQHPEESFAGDTQAAKGVISRVWWSNLADNDSDGCVAPVRENGYLRLHWDGDATLGGTLSIYEKVLRRSSAEGNWLAVFTTPAHTVTGDSEEDSQFADLLPAAGCAEAQYRIELYRAGEVLPDFAIDPSSEPLLAHREEAFAEDLGTAPSITVQPESRTVPPGTTVTLRVEAAGTPPLRYQWYLAGAMLAGQTNDTLVLLKAQQSEAGDYTVVVSNPVGSIASGVATVAIRSATPVRLQNPAITGDGQFQFQIAGDAGAVLQVEYSVALASWKTLATVTNLTGTLTFKDPAPAATHRYFRVVQKQ